MANSRFVAFGLHLRLLHLLELELTKLRNDLLCHIVDVDGTCRLSQVRLLLNFNRKETIDEL